MPQGLVFLQLNNFPPFSSGPPEDSGNCIRYPVLLRTKLKVNGLVTTILARKLFLNNIPLVRHIKAGRKSMFRLIL